MASVKKYEKVLIMQDEDISVYNEDFLSCVPNGRNWWNYYCC